MNTQVPSFDEMVFETPSRESLAERYGAIEAAFERGERTEGLAAWDRARREHASWAMMAMIRFQQDTQSASAKAGRELADMLAPMAQGYDTAIKRRLLADRDRAALEQEAGAHAVRLWETDVATFDPRIAGRLEEESGLAARYTALTSSARLAVEGAVVNLSGIAPYAESLDRDVRHRAAHAKWAFFAENGAALDDIYDKLVKLRHAMARDLGYENFISLAYARMRRVDYGPEDVARYREQIVEHVVPLMARLMEQRRRENKWETLHAWDEPLIDAQGNPKPLGGHDELVDAGQIMFERMDPRLARLYRSMNERGFLDLKNRPGKAPGGFCDAFATTGMPFIFANFNGTHHDVDVLTHEMGHAAQMYESGGQPNFDYLQPTAEAAEINSMALEMLTARHADLLVGSAAADRFRRMHLIKMTNLLAMCAHGDHFQHEVYANPDASPNERHAIWRTLEKRYMPWRNWGDLAYPAGGGDWQRVPHFYGAPFYYIDYALADCCALQFWVRSERDSREALDAYMDLCSRGGSAPFGELVRSAGLISPFEPGALAGAMGAIGDKLGSGA